VRGIPGLALYFKLLIRQFTREMIRTISWFTGLLGVLAIMAGAKAQTPAPAPDFKEVYDLVREHVAGLSEADLNRAAVQGLLSSLAPKVSLASVGAAAGGASEKLPVSKSTLLDGGIAYVRVGQVGEGLAKAVREACDKLGGTNKLQGVVLDLRYAGGDDYAAAANTADLFVKKERPLLDWGKGVVRSKEKEDALGWPVAVLVNHDTAAAAEALAAALRETGAGLILGHKTAGQAMIAQEFPLKDGQVLKVATAPVRLGDGSALPAQGLQPDITVEVSAQDERAYYADAFQPATKPAALAVGSLAATNQVSGTNRLARRPRFNEAELVRERKEGAGAELDLSAASNAGREDPPTVQDPALARALDLLKGLAVVRHSRS
jgi:hypothetical protein